MFDRLRSKLPFGNNHDNKQSPSFLSDLFIGDLDVRGHIEIEIPRATDSVIVIDIATVKKSVLIIPQPVAHSGHTRWEDLKKSHAEDLKQQRLLHDSNDPYTGA